MQENTSREDEGLIKVANVPSMISIVIKVFGTQMPQNVGQQNVKLRVSPFLSGSVSFFPFFNNSVEPQIKNKIFFFS